MEKNKNEELQSRREFFKRAAKGALPILAAVAIASTPTIIRATEKTPMGCDYCVNTCSSSCLNTCTGCYMQCHSQCLGCTGTCDASCSGSCKNSCSGSCKDSCSGSSSR